MNDLNTVIYHATLCYKKSNHYQFSKPPVRKASDYIIDEPSNNGPKSNYYQYGEKTKELSVFWTIFHAVKIRIQQSNTCPHYFNWVWKPARIAYNPVKQNSKKQYYDYAWACRQSQYIKWWRMPDTERILKNIHSVRMGIETLAVNGTEKREWNFSTSRNGHRIY